MSSSVRNKILFLLFFVSGFCGLLYQVVWVRLAFANFGVVTPVLSVILSVFMLGLSSGSWIIGNRVQALVRKSGISALFHYGMTEFLIGMGAFVVPHLFSMGEATLLPLGEIDSTRYLLSSALIIAISILPWCFLMGATFPLMMSFVKEMEMGNKSSFSFLYLANVLGAMLGTALTALVLVEALGFSKTLLLAACSNFFIAIVSFIIGFLTILPLRGLAGFRLGGMSGLKSVARAETGTSPAALWLSPPSKGESGPFSSAIEPSNTKLICSTLFTTGFVSMAMEVVWTRAFTPVLKTTIYSLALLLTVYLAATGVGSYLYRKQLRQNAVASSAKLMTGLAVFSFFPLVLNDPRFQSRDFVVLTSIFPFCLGLGYLTPKLIDQYSSGSPEKAGRAYALNILGSILGPLFAGYILLPWVGVRISMILLALPFLFYFCLYSRAEKSKPAWNGVLGSLALMLLVSSIFFNTSYEEGIPQEGREVRRDYTATVISSGVGMNKRLLVNGIGITQLTPITKIMAHLPLALLDHEPRSALAICFGMGTTFRSLMSWNIRVTAVELVPSVRGAFSYYFNDAGSLMNDPKGMVVIDDGRRFLKRTTERFDLITLDPPPPPEAAGSSLLYSEEFYTLVKERLERGGILEQWFPSGEEGILQAVARTLRRSFPEVRVFRSIEGWGYHFLASLDPIPGLADTVVSRLPTRAQGDLMEWEKERGLREMVSTILARELPLEALLNKDEGISITDNRPYNEYYFMRRTWAKVSRFLKQ